MPVLDVVSSQQGTGSTINEVRLMWVSFFILTGLEGWSSEENSNGGLRQSADGDVVVSPVPGDGGGGGDGTSSSER